MMMMMMPRVGLKVRSALMASVYEHLLRLKAADIADSAVTQGPFFSSPPSLLDRPCRAGLAVTGQLVNLMSTDTERIVNFAPSLHDAWAMPLQLAIALGLLYREVGLAFVAGLAFAIVLVPINKAITSRIGTLSTRMMTWKDKRVNVSILSPSSLSAFATASLLSQMMTELLLGIRSVKLCGWEDKYMAKIQVSLFWISP